MAKRCRIVVVFLLGWVLALTVSWVDRGQAQGSGQGQEQGQEQEQEQTQTDAPSACLRLSDLSAGTGDGVLFDNVAEALSRAGICFHRIHLPASRGTQMLLHGRLDGEMLRVSGYVKLVEDVAFPVEEPVYLFTGYLITEDPQITSLADLVDRPVASVRGLRWSDRVIAEHGLKTVIPVDDGDQLRDLLLRGRVDAILWGGPGLAQTEELSGHHKIPAYQETLHIYLRNEHRARAPAIADALRTYKSAGFAFDMQNGIPPDEERADERKAEEPEAQEQDAVLSN